MQEARTISWILYALEGASSNEGAKCRDISLVADGINHAVPTQKEMSESLKWLCQNNLAVKVGSFYRVTDDGKLFLSSARSTSATIAGVWHALTLQIDAYLEKEL